MGLPYRFVIALDIEGDSLEKAYETMQHRLRAANFIWDETEEWLDTEDNPIPTEQINEVIDNFYLQYEEDEDERDVAE